LTDSLLEILANAANESGQPDGQTISLLVSGFLVTGIIVSYDEFMREHVGLEPEQKSTDAHASGGEKDEGPPNFIHLRDAQCLGGLGIVPNDKGIYLRIPIASINGFSLTRIQRGVKKTPEE